MDDFIPNTEPRQLNVNPSLKLTFKVNEEGLIEYVNDNLSALAGFEEHELIFEPLEVLFHPDMPNTILEMLKDHLKKEKSFKAYLKMQSKDKHFFWVFTEFITKEDVTKQKAHYCNSFAIPDNIIHRIDTLYEILKKIEFKTSDTKTSLRYLKGYLEERGKNYETYIEEIIRSTKSIVEPKKNDTENLNLVKKIFGK